MKRPCCVLRGMGCPAPYVAIVVAAVVWRASSLCLAQETDARSADSTDIEVSSKPVKPPESQFAREAGEAFVNEIESDFDRLKMNAMHALYFTGEYTHPSRKYDNLEPRDIYPEQYDAFQDWTEDNMIDAVLEALENHPGVARAINRVLSVFSPGVVTESVEDEEEFEYSALEERAMELERERRRTLALGRVDGPSRLIFGDNYQMVSRFVWLDVDDGFQDVVRWETTMLNVELFGVGWLSMDKIELEVTYDAAELKLSKANPFDLPILVTTQFKYEEEDFEWGLIFTIEKRDMERFARQREDPHLAKIKKNPPLIRKIDFGVRGLDDGALEFGFVFRGFV